MRILVLTTLFPNAEMPHHGVFVENRLRALAARGHEIRVIAPVPWFPFKSGHFGRYAKFARVPWRARRGDLVIEHPRYFVLPKIGMTAAVWTLTMCFQSAIAAQREAGFEPDLIDAHYLFPDGVAATRAANQSGLPVCLTARGSDVTQIPAFRSPRRLIREALKTADGLIAVADALKHGMVDLGAPARDITTIRNGVDLEVFSPEAEDALKKQLGVGGPLLLSVGHLIERKGHDKVISALKDRPDTTLLIIGEGPQRVMLESYANELGVADRVRFIGSVPHEELRTYYGAADALVLASSREGCANVLLEALACGTPCVATPVGGSPEIIDQPEAGQLAASESAADVADAIVALLKAPPSRNAVRALAVKRHGWAPVAEQVERVWHRAASHRQGLGVPTTVPSALGRRILLTIDAEEVFDWHGDYTTWSLPPLAAIKRVQAIVEPFGIKPLYFVSYPLLANEALGGYFAGLFHQGRADLGLHPHTWSTPPYARLAEGASTYQSALDPDHHAEQLATFCQLFRQRTGFAPNAHRAGRYGIAPWVLDQLAEHGITHDFSPSSGFDYRGQGGPDFSHIVPVPHSRTAANGKAQWIIPLSGGRARRRLPGYAEPDSPSLLSWPRWLTTGQRLTPEGQPLSDMHRLVQHLEKTGADFLVPSLHLTSLVPNATPYAGTQEEATAVGQQLEAFLKSLMDQGYRPTEFDALREALPSHLPEDGTST